MSCHYASLFIKEVLSARDFTDFSQNTVNKALIRESKTLHKLNFKTLICIEASDSC